MSDPSAPVEGIVTRSATPELRVESRPIGAWAERAGELRRREGATFMDLFAGPVLADGRIAMTLVLARPEAHDWLALRDSVAPGGRFPSLSGPWPAADWYEREAFETYGLAADGHRHLHPLGHLDGGGADRLLAELRPGPAAPGVVDYPLGPVRSGIVESGHYTLRTVGEEIVDLRLQLAFKHRGIEALATSIAWPLVPLLAERISGTDAVAHGLSCAAALEALAERRPTPRALALRVIAGELERLHDHVAFQAELCQATGLVVAQAQFEIVRERILRLAARRFGHRYLFGFVVPGGVARDLDDEGLADLTRTVTEALREIEALGRLVRGSGSHLDRLQGTGRVTLDQAAALALTGPVARAAGLDLDARRDLPYATYGATAIPVAIAEGGDAAARAAVRLEEAQVAADLILETAARLPAGPAAVGPAALPAAPLRASAVGIGWAEGSRGTEIHWLETGPEGRLARYRVRSASFACWQAFARCIPGDNILTDFPIIEQSFGLSYAGSDR